MPWRRAERSELVHIVVTGYQKRKYPRKYYVFVIDVTWNNSDRFEIYRRYSEFFSFQTTLKGLFPDAAGRRSAERTIPQLPKRIFVGRSHVAKVAEARLEQINRYCQTLVSLDPKISESSHVVGFFSPRIADKALPKLHLHRPASLHPQKVPAGSLFEEYCALAEFQSDDASQVSFVSGQIVLVLNKDSSGWWLCKVDNKVGWAPPSYLKQVEKGDSTEGESDSDDDYLGVPGFVDPEKEKEGGMDNGLQNNQENKPQLENGSARTFNVPEIEFQEYRAIDSYEAQGDGQVSFEEGDIIQVLDKIEDGWWFVAKGQEEGWVPCSYLEPTKLQDEDNTISSLDVEHYITVEEYTAEEEDELSFPKGVVVDVLQKSLDGWWLIKYDGVAALAPATFLVKKDGGENSPVVGRKPSVPTLVDTPEEGTRSESREAKTQASEKVNSLTRFQQPPRKQSVRMRVSIRKMGNVRGITSKGIQAPPTIKEESPTPTLSQARKLSLESSVPTQTSSLPAKQKVVRKLSEQPIPTQERVLVSPSLPGVRKISLDAALSGAPKMAANGALVHQVARTPPPPVADADSDTEDHEYLNIDPKAKRQLKLNGFQQKTTSPATSDSEVDSSSSSWAGKKDSGGFRQVKINGLQNHLRQWDQRQSSDSEDSLSSPQTVSRPPIATPRAKKPELKPKPKLVGTHQVPPRPNRSQIDRARGKQNKDPQPHPQAEKQPSMPQRPRVTEIRRARLGKQTPSPLPPPSSPTHTPSSTPTITATSDKGNQRVVLSSKNSAFTPISPRRSPSPNRSGLAVVREEGAEEPEPVPGSIAVNRPLSPRGKFPDRSLSPSPSPVATLAPPQNSRKSRSHSESDTPDLATSPTLSPSASPIPPLSAGFAGVNPFNQQMAETIIKYILASPDSALKNALRDCIMSDPEAVKALQK